MTQTTTLTACPHDKNGVRTYIAVQYDIVLMSFRVHATILRYGTIGIHMVR